MRCSLARRLARAQSLAFLLAVIPFAGAAPLHIERGVFGSGRALVTCTMDGVEQECVIDTGSILSIVADPEQFSTYRSQGKIRFQSAAGVPVEADKIRLRTLVLDRRRFSNVQFARVNRGNKLQNTIGIDILSKQPFTLEFTQRAVLELGAKYVPASSSGLEAYPWGMFSIPVRIGAADEKAVWDTAAELTAVDEKYVAAHPESFTLIRELNNTVDGTDHPVRTALFNARSVRIGARTFRNVRVLAVDLGTIHRGAARDIQVVLGFNIIRKADWYFDLPNRRWTIR